LSGGGGFTPPKPDKSLSPEILISGDGQPYRTQMGTLVIRGIGELCTCDARQGAAPGVIHSAALVAHDGVIT
jgi:hypothetical protein